MNPTQASNKATALVSIMTNICLRWMEAFWNRCISVLLSFRLAQHDVSYSQELRTQLQVHPLGGGEVDLQVDFVVLLGEVDHPLHREELIRLSDRQHRRILYRLQDLGQMPLLRGADKEDLAVLDVRSALDLLDHDFAAVDSLVSRNLLEFIANTVFPDHVNHDGGIGVRERVGRPIHILGEVKQE